MSKPNDGRLTAIAYNALQEARKAHGVGDMPWGDKDARLAGMITKLLMEVQEQKHYTENDSGKLVPQTQVQMDKPLVDVEGLLEKIDGPDAPLAPHPKLGGFVSREMVRRVNDAVKNDPEFA